MFNEATTATVYEGDVDTFAGEGNTVDTDTTTGLFPDTPAPERPVPKPQAHRGEIIGISVGTAKESGQQFLQVSYKSLDTGSEDNLTIFPPQEYIDNPQVDPNTLSDEPGPISETTGRPTPSIRAKYAFTVRNSKHDGSIEKLVAYAVAQGHTAPNRLLPRTFQQTADYLNEFITGTNVIALLRPQGGDGDFADRLKTKSFGDYAQKDNPKFFKGYRRLWLNE